MKLFGLAAEGVTDQVTIETILCGYFNNPDLDESITYLQPLYDETDQKSAGGGWSILLKYLASTYFRDDVVNTEFMVLQIDSDIADKLGISGSHQLSIDVLVNHIKTKLIACINSGAAHFYEDHAEKFLFAICVHSLECWLVAHYAEQSAIHDCFEVLKAANLSMRVTKKRENYRQLSEPFLNRNHIDAAANKDLSFRLFIQALAVIEDAVVAAL